MAATTDHRTDVIVRLSICCSVLGLSIGAAGLPAQAVDWSKLTAGLSVGRIGGSLLWHVPGQPISSIFEPVADTFDLTRSIMPGTTIGINITYFPKAHVGWTIDLTDVGLGTNYTCSVAYGDGDPFLDAACKALALGHTQSTAMTFQGGVIVRPLTATLIQPYARAMFGLASTPVSTIYTRADVDGQAIVIYQDAWNGVRPVETVAVGISTGAMQGIQFRLEFRDTRLSFPTITGATFAQNQAPATQSSVKIFPQILLGADVVFSKTRGHRY